MDTKEEKSFMDLQDKASSIFTEFMLRIAKFEELVDMAHQFLVGYRQELDTFRRPQLYKTSDLVDRIIEDNLTNRMKAYVEAGSRHRHHDVQNLIKLNSCTQGLQDHIRKVKVMLDELKSLKEDAIGIASTGNHNSPIFVDKSTGDTIINERLYLDEEDTEESLHLQDKSISLAVLMSAIYNMFSFHYTMQENIINSIDLASSEQLESYCLMWDLRPYINDNIMRRAWALISR